ncbi:hypothetical protein EX30DRAFT_333356 [Ascodesmis nigricans]|uniref:PQ loop repeat protein n=1 Tax=Ascodesmis nigricans TaxID=341454 RepID=A0A4S2MQU3_9PEZI|nr:hypothetical protein EX30DRAFT_333356 [Ascodesmis nigricans]
MGLMDLLISYVAPVFLITSPITSYGDQIRSIHIRRSSQGFSLDTPLIMLIASILRCFYWLGNRFELSLLYQSLLQILVQLILLKTALDHRPPPIVTPFSPSPTSTRPYNFWQWRSPRPYWEFLTYFTLTTTVLQLLFGRSMIFVSLLGAVGLGIEALLPLPQALQNEKRKSCDGFRITVLASWLAGDAMKLVFFWNAEKVGVMFKACAVIQSCLDAFLGIQFWRYGNGPAVGEEEGHGRAREGWELDKTAA